jgi:5-hydroxyisourate hydrolase
MARLSTHVLDTAGGKPAAGVRVRLFSIHDEVRSLIKVTATNSDGRTDEPLLSGDRLEPGIYELAFGVGDYFTVPAVPFLDEVLVRFVVSDPKGNYHVPLLVSPYGYTTYKGS